MSFLTFTPAETINNCHLNHSFQAQEQEQEQEQDLSKQTAKPIYKTILRSGGVTNLPIQDAALQLNSSLELSFEKNDKFLGVSAPQIPNVSKVALDLNHLQPMTRRPVTEPCAPPIDIIRPKNKSSIWINSPTSRPARRLTPPKDDDVDVDVDVDDNNEEEDPSSPLSADDQKEDETVDQNQKDTLCVHDHLFDCYGAIFPLSPPVTPPLQFKKFQVEEKIGASEIRLVSQPKPISSEIVNTTTLNEVIKTLPDQDSLAPANKKVALEKEEKQKNETESSTKNEKKTQTNCFVCSRKVKDQQCCRTISKAANRKPCRCGHPFCATHP